MLPHKPLRLSQYNIPTSHNTGSFSSGGGGVEGGVEASGTDWISAKNI
jgi:hypothetical protein